MKAELRIYPDIVGCVGRRQKLGCLGLLLALPAMVLAGPIAFLMAIPVFILKIVFYPVTLVLAYLMKFKLDYIARRILRDPSSSYAIKKMFELSPLLPRYWRRGDVVQLVRIPVKRFLCGRRDLILFVTENPIPRRPGCLEALMSFFLAKRRVYFVCMDKGEAEADAAAQESANILGIKVDRARFIGAKMKLS
jgi:hypothetical protein